MKKKILCMLSLLLCLWLCISLAACGKSKHEAKSEWKYDEKVHWHECATKGHDDRMNVADHNFDSGVISVEPTETESGTKTFTCGVCGYQKTETIAKLSHTHTFDMANWESDESAHWHKATCEHTEEKDGYANHRWNDGVITKQATETAEGEKTFTCNDCGRTKTESIGTLSHTHTFDTANWESDETHHWHKATCEHTSEKESYAAHSFDAGVVTKAATETAEGEKTYTCGVCGYKKTETIARLDHTHKFDESKWSSDANKHWHAASCGHDVKKDEADHSFDTGVVTKAATETAEGEKTYTCGVCGYKKTEIIARLDHTHKFDESKWSSDANKHWHAASCGHDVKKDEASHSFDAGVVTKAATETAEGEKTYTCGVCGYKKTETIARLDHTHKFDESKWSSDANKHWHAASCGHDVKKDEASHSFDAGAVTKAATETAEGEKTYTCGVCGYKKTETIARLDHTHKFDESKWSSDANKHWHAASCGHNVKKDEAEHKFTGWTVETPAGYGTTGTEKASCNVCGYVARRTIPALTAKDNTVTVGTIDFTYNAKSQPIDSLVTASNKAGMVIKYVGVDGTTYAESTAAPTNAGTYQYTITIPATAEWKAAEVNGTFTIAKYELTVLYEKTHTKEYDGNVMIFVEYKSLEGTDVNIAIFMKSKDVGAEINRIQLPGLLKDNYTYDQSKVTARITPKVLSGLKFSVNASDIDKSSETFTIEREITGANNEKLIVTIEFRWVDLDNEDELELKTYLPAEGAFGCKISLKEANSNYVFGNNIGFLELIRYSFG